jgi:membrane fusion protein, multidrug efflux system
MARVNERAVKWRRASFSLSPQRGEGRGEGWELKSAQVMGGASESPTPHPLIPLPVEGRGKPCLSRPANLMRWHSIVPLAAARLFLLSCGVAALLISGCSKQNASAPGRKGDSAIAVDVQLVSMTNVDRVLPVVGTLFAKDEATLGAEVEGKVEKTLVDFGDRVKAGQELALIDTKSYEAMANQALANVAKARATADNMEKDLKRVEALGQISSQSDRDKASSAADQARAEVKAAEAAEAIAKLNVERSHVRAPFDAAVAERIASAGDFKRIGDPVFRVVNDGVLKYIVQAPERYAGQVQKQQLVTFTVDAHPGEKFEGKVFLISPQINTTTRAFAFGALVPNAERRLRANTFARGELVLERNVSVSVVPLDAVVNFVGINKIFVVENGLAKARVVEVGRVFNNRQEILSGVKPGESIVVAGQSKLFDGAKVRVKEANGKQS